MLHQELSDIEDVVQSLYSNNDPRYIRETQSKLLAIQRSDQGWQMANKLLQSQHATCQFFGALTFTVRMNSMTADEMDADPLDLLKQLLQWLVYHKQNQAPRYVLQKIISTLSVFFAKFPKSWPRCVESVVASMQAGQPVLSTEPIQLQETSRQDLIHGLWFCETLLQDLGNENQAQLTNQQKYDTSAVLLQNLSCASLLIKQALDLGFNNPGQVELDLVRQALNTLGIWIAYFGQSRIDSTGLQPFSSYLLAYLSNPPDEEVYSTVAGIISDTYAYRPSFWPKDGFKEQIIQVLLNQGHSIKEDEEVDDKIQGYVSMVTALCGNYSKQCIEREPPFDALVDIMLKLTRLPGTPAMEECSIAAKMLEFWTNYMEEWEFLDTPTEPDGLIPMVIDAFWDKIRLPDEESTQDWNSDNWDEFNTFRRDFGDFLELVPLPISKNMFDALITNTVEELNKQVVNWQEVECCFYSLNALAEHVDNAQVNHVRFIIESPLFRRLSECHVSRVHTTVVRFVGRFDSFFESEQGQAHIAGTLEYLFTSLSNQKIAITSSKSILKLCTIARSYLGQLLPDFMNVYEDMVQRPDLNSAAHEHTVCAIATVIEGCELHAKAEYLARLVTALTKQIEPRLRQGDEESIEKLVSLVKCLAQIGKGLQVPPEREQKYSDEQADQVKQFWDRDERGIRQKVVQVIRVLSIDQAPYNQQVDICGACCQVFKEGFREDIGNPFTFPGEYVLEFLRSKYNQGPSTVLGALTDTACCFLTSHTIPQDKASRNQIATEIMGIFFSDPSSEDPDDQVNKLKLLTQVIKHHRTVLVNHPNAGNMIEFALASFASDTKLVLEQGCKFWAEVVQDSNTSPLIYQNDSLIGAKLCEILVNKIAGGAARSDLTYYIGVIRKLVFRHPQLTKDMFQRSLDTNRQLHNKDDTFKRTFLSKLFVSRGGSETEHIVKDFWKECRGLNYA